MTEVPGRLAVDLDAQSRWHRSVALWCVVVLYLVVRIAAWLQSSLLEDHDSVSLLLDIRAVREAGLNAFRTLGPDTTPLYPVLGGLATLVAGGEEAAARLTSVVMSALLLLVLVPVARDLGGTRAAVAGLLLVALNPFLIGLSVAVLTEPTFVGLVYVGIWLFWRQRGSLALRPAVWIGFTFGLAFLSRAEGFLFLAIIPLLKLADTALDASLRPRLRQLFGWTAVFGLCFAVVATPQIVSVSNKLGSPAVNGRQVWVMINNELTDKTYEERIYGLDYSPSEINLDYLQRVPEARERLRTQFSIGRIAKSVIVNVEDLYDIKLGTLVGILPLFLFAAGLFALVEDKRAKDVVLILLLLLGAAVAPLLHIAAFRHLAVLLPLTLLVAGRGAVHITERIAATYPRRMDARAVLALILILAVLPESPSIRRTLNAGSLDRWSNREYDPEDLAGPIRVLQTIARSDSTQAPRVAARKAYLPYFANALRVVLPYTDLPGLIRYCRLNRVDFLYIDFGDVEGFPFRKQLLERAADYGLEVLYTGTTARGGPTILYRVAASRAAEASPSPPQPGSPPLRFR